MSHPIHEGEVLISLAAAALTAAEADAAKTGALIFRPQWRPETRTRSPTSQPQGNLPDSGERQPWSWLSFLHQLTSSRLQPQQDQLRLAPLAEPAPPSTSAPPTAGAPPPPPPAPSVPASPPTPERPHSFQRQRQEDAVAELVKRNTGEFDKIIDHPFPRALGNGTASLDGFRYFMIQDKMYLEIFARLKMMAVSDSPNFREVENFNQRHQSSLENVTHLKNICISMLGITESTIDTTLQSVQLNASESFYKESLRQEDALLAYYVALLPCMLSYWRIAERLVNDPSTVKNVVYHSAWTDHNNDGSSAVKYTQFINENIMAKGGVDRWNKVFRTACLHEANFFDTGLQAPAPYNIIPDGTYFIHCSSPLESVVLAVQNIKGFLRSPKLDTLLGGYFPSDAGSSVVGVNKTGGDNEKWHAIVTKDGYKFQNLGTGLYLGVATELDRNEGRILKGAMEPYYWWINPVSGEPSRAPYQIYDSVNLRNVLHADKEVLNSDEPTNFPYTPTIARENLGLPCQMWSFNGCTQLGPDEHKESAESTQKILRRPDVMIGIMGPTGTGKSSFIKLITDNKNVTIGHGVRSMTSDIGRFNCFAEDGRCVTFVDTPGFDDSRQGQIDIDILRKIASFLDAEFQNGNKLSGLIYLHRITDPRMGDISNHNLKVFRKLCGDDALKNVVIVTTRWDDIHEKDRQAMGRREEELMKTKGEFFEPLIAAGGRFLRHNNTVESARRIMDQILHNDPIALRIQVEMKEGVTLEDTAAGSELAAEMKRLIANHSSKMELLRKQIKEAIADKDEKSRKELEEERVKHEQEKKKWEAARQKLAADFDSLKDKLEAKDTVEEEREKLKAKVKGHVTLSGLSDIKIVGGHQRHMDATIVANIFNSSAIDITVSSSVEMSYDQARIGYAELMGLHLHPGHNAVLLQWKLQLRSDADVQVRDFINQYLTTSKEIPVLLHAKVANITTSDQQLPFHDLEALSYIRGIGSCFISRVYAYPGVKAVLRSIDFKFVFENPLDTSITIHKFVVNASIKGTPIIHVEHVFNESFTVPGKKCEETPLIPNAHLVQAHSKTVSRLISSSNRLDVTINSATVSVGSFRLEALQFNLTDVPFSYKFLQGLVSGGGQWPFKF